MQYRSTLIDNLIPQTSTLIVDGSSRLSVCKFANLSYTNNTDSDIDKVLPLLSICSVAATCSVPVALIKGLAKYVVYVSTGTDPTGSIGLTNFSHPLDKSTCSVVNLLIPSAINHFISSCIPITIINSTFHANKF